MGPRPDPLVAAPITFDIIFTTDVERLKIRQIGCDAKIKYLSMVWIYMHRTAPKITTDKLAAFFYYSLNAFEVRGRCRACLVGV